MRRAVVVVVELFDVLDVDTGVRIGCQANADDDVGARLQPLKCLAKVLKFLDCRRRFLPPLSAEVTAPLKARALEAVRPSVREYDNDALRTRTLVHAVGRWQAGGEDGRVRGERCVSTGSCKYSQKTAPYVAVPAVAGLLETPTRARSRRRAVPAR